MRGRLRSAFGGAAQAHLHRAVGHVDDALLADDRVDLIDHAAVVGFQLVVGDLVDLEGADHLHIIATLHALGLGLGHQRRQLAHGRAGLHELQVRALDQLLRGDVDPDLLELEGVQRFG